MGSAGLGCGSRMAKCFLFIFNIIFWLIGAIVLGVGIWVLVDPQVLQLIQVASVDSSDQLVRGAAITFIVIGLIVFVTGFLGCCGALKENACMLLMYAIIVGFVLLLQFIGGIMGAVFKDRILGQLEESMNKTVTQRYGKPDQTGLTTAYDLVQKEFKCCGAINGPSDWDNSYWKTQQGKANGTNYVVPVTCCPLVDKNAENPIARNVTSCMLAAADAQMADRDMYIWTKGCRPQLESWVKSHAGVLIGVAFGLAAIQIITIIAACVLYCEVRNDGVTA